MCSPLVVLLLLSIAGPASAAASKGQCGAATDPAAEPKYSYSDVFSPERDQGIAFASEFSFLRVSLVCGDDADDDDADDAAASARAHPSSPYPPPPPLPPPKDLPGFTRSFYDHDHALITHESRVWLPGLKW
jgi:hypothetical protein